MRRAIAVAAVSGLALGGVSALPAWAAERGQAPGGAPVPASARTGPAAMKTVVYRGYQLRVPASWPVYRLDQYPSTCVRYDVHAVYLGTPGVNQRCPAGLIGRTQTVSVIPSTVVAAGSGAQVTYQRAQPGLPGSTPVAEVSAVRGAIVRNSAQHELRMAVTAAGSAATVLATYGNNAAVVERVLASLRAAPAGARATGQSAPAPALPQAGAVPQAGARQAGAAPAAAERGGTPRAAAPATTTSWRGVPAGWPVQVVAPPSPRPARKPVSGFDTCAAPSLRTMKAWRRAYSAIGVYIGGVNAACAFGNLSASWIRSAAAMGWGMIPTYVGPQAPCYGYGVMINPKQAAAQGRAAGDNAVADAKLFGLPRMSPIYYDMEAYDASSNSGCVPAVLTFLGAWDREVTARGYVSAVYSSQASGITDMQAAAAAKRAGFTVPQAIWIALWDNRRTLSDGSLVWPVSARSKQYQGPHNQTVGGITLNIDGDLVGGPLAR